LKEVGLEMLSEEIYRVWDERIDRERFRWLAGPDLGAGDSGLSPPTNRGPLTKPFQFYFSLMIDAYETTTLF